MKIKCMGYGDKNSGPDCYIFFENTKIFDKGHAWTFRANLTFDNMTTKERDAASDVAIGLSGWVIDNNNTRHMVYILTQGFIIYRVTSFIWLCVSGSL